MKHMAGRLAFAGGRVNGEITARSRHGEIADLMNEFEALVQRTKAGLTATNRPSAEASAFRYSG